jgi:hypothetical protein
MKVLLLFHGLGTVQGALLAAVVTGVGGCLSTVSTWVVEVSVSARERGGGEVCASMWQGRGCEPGVRQALQQLTAIIHARHFVSSCICT